MPKGHDGLRSCCGSARQLLKSPPSLPLGFLTSFWRSGALRPAILISCSPPGRPTVGKPSTPLTPFYLQANLLLAFEYRGGWRDVHGAVVMTVLNYLLGGGNSFSSGGPGKGMHSRLYTRVLNKYAWVHSCASFNTTFNESGMVGIQVGCWRGSGRCRVSEWVAAAGG